MLSFWREVVWHFRNLHIVVHRWSESVAVDLSWHRDVRKIRNVPVSGDTLAEVKDRWKL